MAQLQLKALAAQNITPMLQRRAFSLCLCACVCVRMCAYKCQLARMSMRDSMCPCIPNRVCDAFCLSVRTNVQVCVRACSTLKMEPSIGLWADSSLKRRACICISGHGWEKKTNRKKDRMREQKIEEERGGKKKKRWGGVEGVDHTCQATRG